MVEMVRTHKHTVYGAVSIKGACCLEPGGVLSDHPALKGGGGLELM